MTVSRFSAGCSAAAILFAAAFSGVVNAAPPPWQLSSSVTYAAGDYGTQSDSELVYVPVTLKRRFADGYGSVTVPFVRIDEEDSGVAQGLGDILLKGVWYASDDESPIHPGIDIGGKVKLPTASEGDDLGTGELDAGPGLELYHWLDWKWVVLGDLYYLFIGDPEYANYDNQITADVGMGHRTTADWFNSVYLDYRSAVDSGDDDSVAVLYFSSLEVERNADLVGGIALGLSDGAPDIELTVGFSVGLPR